MVTAFLGTGAKLINYETNFFFKEKHLGRHDAFARRERGLHGTEQDAGTGNKQDVQGESERI